MEKPYLQILITNNSFYFRFPSQMTISIERRLPVLNKLISLYIWYAQTNSLTYCFASFKEHLSIEKTFKNFDLRHPYSQNNEKKKEFNSDFPRG